jgi:hypothetical protein
MSDIHPRGVVRIKPGVLFTTIAPAGFRLLAAIEGTARQLAMELTITSACDGVHSGPDDPHHRGEAYDVRTHGMSEAMKDAVCRMIIGSCSDGFEVPPFPLASTPRSIATSQFFGFVEKPGTADEHIHVQLRKGRLYP